MAGSTPRRPAPSSGAVEASGGKQRDERLSRFRSFNGPGDRDELGPFLGRLAALVGLIVAIQIVGMVAYALIEDVSLWQGFLYTLDTVATVGSYPTPDDLAGQILKVLLIVLGVGTLFYALVTVTEFFVAGHLGEILEERRTLKKIDDLSGHHLICGFGRVGRNQARPVRARLCRLRRREHLHLPDRPRAPRRHHHRRPRGRRGLREEAP